MNCMRSAALVAILVCLSPPAFASSGARRLLDAKTRAGSTVKGVPTSLPRGADTSLVNPTTNFPTIQEPAKPIFEASVGGAFGTQGSIAQTGPTGDCIAQSFTVGTGQTVSVGGGQSEVGGQLSGQSGCKENAKPLSSGASFSTGFVLTGAVRTGTVGGPTNCFSRTNGFGRSNSFTRGDINTSAGGGFTGGSQCDDSKQG